MKRLFCLLILFSFLFISGCSASKKQVNKENIVENFAQKGSYRAEIEVSSENFTYTFSLNRKKPDYYRAQFLKPEQLAGFILESTGNENTIKYKGFSISLDFLPVPVKNGLGAINNVLLNIDEALNMTKIKSVTKESVVFSGNVANGSKIELEISLNELKPIFMQLSDGTKTYNVIIRNFEYTKE